MDAVHLHLMLNHLPVIGIVLVGILLAVALFTGNAQFQRVSLWFLILLALAAIPVYLTGEPTEERVENLPGISGAVIERHEDIAKFAFVALEILGGAALVSLLAYRKSARLPKALLSGVLALTVVSAGLFSWTGWTGGQIRHTEIRSGTQAATGSQPENRQEKKHEKENDGH
ncbi:MAG TPA: DUF2231 domain-containing protein [Blastocatellia bacterium]|nr:DUF2231 domain-containing protein [Blastocatellia bacterium]